ncbi:hypothetical protein GCM10022227_46090 [Streptomyces sedi]
MLQGSAAARPRPVAPESRPRRLGRGVGDMGGVLPERLVGVDRCGARRAREVPKWAPARRSSVYRTVSYGANRE